MQTTIYFVRHGEVYNPTNIWYGRLPEFALSKDGEKQIEQTAEFLAKENIDILYASPLLRAKQTAEIIKKHLHLSQTHYSDSLLEIDSSLQGTSFAQIKKRDYDIFAGEDKKDVQGETIEEVMNRIENFMQEMIKKYPGKKIAVVTHGDIIMLVRAKITHLPIKNQSLRPGPDEYVHHGEIYKIACDEYIPYSFKKIFKPM